MQVQAMNAMSAQTLVWPKGLPVPEAGHPVQPPELLVINGDLTYFGDDVDFETFERFYSIANSEVPTLRYPVLFGLGNHDYENNVRDCYAGTANSNECADRAMNYLRAAISCGYLSNFQSASITNYDDASLAYSWDIGHYHFVQLNNYPTYPAVYGKSKKDIGVQPSIPWLKKDLAQATAAGQRVVLNMHQVQVPGNDVDWTMTDSGFQDAIRGTALAAVFAGHLHGNHGFQTNVPGTGAGVFLSGSSSNHTFLVAHFAEDHITIGVISSQGGTPVFLDGTTTTVHMPPSPVAH